jgi:hypothetical protein
VEVGVPLDHFVGERGARADDAHRAAQHVPELRDLVDREPAQHASDARDARIVVDLEQRTVRFVVGHQRGAPLLRVDVHGAQLEHREQHAVAADPELAEEDRAGRVDLDRHGDDEQHRRGDRERERGDRHVEGALGVSSPTGPDPRLDVHEGLAVEVLRADPVEVDVVKSGRQRDVEAVVAQRAGEAVETVGVERGDRHDRPVAAVVPQRLDGVVERGEHGASGPLAEVVVADEADHLVPERRAAVDRVHESDGVQIGPDHRDPSPDPPARPEPGEDPSHDPPFEDERGRDAREQQRHHEPRQQVVLHEEADRHECAGGDRARHDQSTRFLRRSLDGARRVADFSRMWTPHAEPSPITWARPTFAPSIWRGPPSSRRCWQISQTLAMPVAEMGCPFDCRPPDTFTGVDPSRHVAPERKKSAAPPSSHSIRLS